MRELVSVLTPTIRERRQMLEECELTVKFQTYQEVEHVIRADEHHDGCSVTINRCFAASKGDWVLPLADDDLLLPGGISALLHESEHADVVYAPPLVTGNEDRWWFFQEPPAIPSTALIRRSLWAELGGYDESLNHEEDRDMWTKALEQGARFARVDEPVWIYRQHAQNKSFNKATV